MADQNSGSVGINTVTVPIRLALVDGIDKDRGRVYFLPEIYTGPNGTGKYVPEIDDLIVDYTQGWLRVTDLDVGSNLATWEPWVPATTGDVTIDTLLGTVPGYASESYRVYYDKSVTPHVFAIDKRLRMYGSEASYVMIFKGTDISKATGRVIGYMVDETGHIGSQQIPLELVAIDDAHNLSVKAPKLSYTSDDLVDGDVVTVVVYSTNDTVLSYQKMLVKDTSFTANGSVGTKFITSIGIDSPYLDTAQENRFRIPLYTDVNSIAMRGVINYSDNSSRSQNLVLGNGGKMRIMGLENFTATVVGQKVPLVLAYYLDSTEETYGAQSSDGSARYITQLFEAVVEAVDSASAVKLFVVPTWVDDNTGWKLDWWLYSLDRKTYYYVTPYVTLGQTSADFQPKLYGQRQNLSFVIDLAKVDSRFKPILHAQTVQITLVQPGPTAGDPWYIRYSPGQDPMYGKGISAKFKFGSVDNWGVKVDCGAKTQDAWLEALYYRAQPLYFPDTETQGLKPTHFVVVAASDAQVEYPISAWNQELAIKTGGTEGEGIHIRWIYRDSSNNDLYLAASPMVVRHVTDYGDGTSI